MLSRAVQKKRARRVLLRARHPKKYVLQVTSGAIPTRLPGERSGPRSVATSMPAYLPRRFRLWGIRFRRPMLSKSNSAGVLILRKRYSIECKVLI